MAQFFIYSEKSFRNDKKSYKTFLIICRKEGTMKNRILNTKSLFLLFISITILILTGCNNSPTGPQQAQSTADQQAMLKVIESDSAVASFTPNYNEESAMNIIGKTSVAIYPFQVGQKMRLVSKNFTYTMVGDTAFGTYTATFEGVLYIEASYDSTTRTQDTLIQKPFTTVITRKVILLKLNNSRYDTTNFDWRVLAISLPSGGTLNSNIQITKLTMYMPDGSVVIINDPNDYYLMRGQMGGKMHGHRGWGMMPDFLHDQKVTIQATVSSAYADTDFVTLTHGARLDGMNRQKLELHLVSSTPSGSGYVKVYEGTFVTHSFPGFSTAVINAFPRQVIYDDSTPVEADTWGVPYFIER